MKILQLTYNLSSGGGERFVVDLSNELTKDNAVILVQIESRSNPSKIHYLPDLDPRIKYVNLDCKSGLSKDVFYKVYKIVKEVQPDVVHIHCGLIAAILPIIFCRSIRYIHTLHSLASRCLEADSKLLKPVYKLLYRRYVKPVTISKACNESFSSLYEEESICINNGRSPILTTSCFEEIRREVNRLKLHSDDKTYIHVARFHPVKNQQLLFETFEKLLKEGEHVQLIVIGNGFDGSPLEKYGNIPGINLLGEKRNVGDYLASSDFFILSSLMEGLPISLLEAMSLGLVPVSTPAGGVCDVIRNGENGFLSLSHSIDDFYLAVKNSITHQIDTSKIKNEYYESYSMTSCAEKYKRYYCS